LVGNELTASHKQGAVAIVIMSSNSGMCGAFNSRMIKELSNLPVRYPGEELIFFPVGKKIREALTRAGFTVHANLDGLASKISFQLAADLTDELAALFRSQKIKKADIVYYHYKSAATQIITYEQLLPYVLPEFGDPTMEDASDPDGQSHIFEPSRQVIFNTILPQVLRSQCYMALADNHTSEHGARVLAMQMASENANAILEELRLNYNKIRQQNITSELLDIVGGLFA
jgi:F-type H+-transporting ATPase subunit gamma